MGYSIVLHAKPKHCSLKSRLLPYIPKACRITQVIEVRFAHVNYIPNPIFTLKRYILSSVTRGLGTGQAKVSNV